MRTRFSTTLIVVALLTASHAHAADAEQAAIAAIEKIGGTVRPVSMDTDWKDVDFHLGGNELTDAGLVPLKAIKNLVWLNLKDTKITDAGLAQLKDLKGLKRLHLERTKISDAGLAHLAGLQNLEYLNLYGTPVTDGGLAQLKGLKKLKKLYLWQTKVTDKGTADLKKALPGLYVNLGGELKIIVKKPEPKKPETPKAKPGPPPKKSLAKGQFVKIRLKGDGKILSLAEVQVHQTGDGAELHKAGKVSQSSVAYGGDPKRAIDGNLDQNYNANSVTHTKAESNPFWLLDLGGVKDIGRIKIFNRGDGVGERLDGAIVEILDPAQKVVHTVKITGAKTGSVHEFVTK